MFPNFQKDDVPIQNIMSAPATVVDNTQETDEPNWNCVFCQSYNQFCVKYISQMVILSGCIIFSLVKLSDENTQNREFYSSLLSFSLGIALPHPTPSIK